jgi:hypothetical protein
MVVSLYVHLVTAILSCPHLLELCHLSLYILSTLDPFLYISPCPVLYFYCFPLCYPAMLSLLLYKALLICLVCPAVPSCLWFLVLLVLLVLCCLLVHCCPSDMSCLSCFSFLSMVPGAACPACPMLSIVPTAAFPSTSVSFFRCCFPLVYRVHCYFSCYLSIVSGAAFLLVLYVSIASGAACPSCLLCPVLM